MYGGGDKGCGMRDAGGEMGELISICRWTVWDEELEKTAIRHY
jgi:hypothetical protein